MSNLAEMVEERPHANDNFQCVECLACLLKEVDCHLADLGRRVVELRDEQAEGPRIRFWCRKNELAKVLSRVEADVLMKKGVWGGESDGHYLTTLGLRGTRHTM